MLNDLYPIEKPIVYEIWAADYFDYRDIEWNCYAVYTDKERAEAELEKLRRKAGEGNGIIKYRLQERMTR